MRNSALQGLAVGFFDGVHLGHQSILKGADAALTFRSHPLSVLAPERAPRLIMTCEERVAAIKACGVGEVTVLDFTPELAAMPAEEFANSVLKRSGDRFPVLRCGANWRFGKGGTGDAAFLRLRGIDVEVDPARALSLITSAAEAGLIEAVDEFKRCCITPMDLRMASEQTGGSLAQKLEELYKLHADYTD